MTFIYTLYGQKIVMVYNYYLIGGHIQRPCRSILPLVVIRDYSYSKEIYNIASASRPYLERCLPSDKFL